jgi:hypothetical protein
MNQFLEEYWMFAEALLARTSDLLGVSTLNHLAAALGYPFAAALALSGAGCIAALVFLWLGRPGWGLAGLAVGEELSALALASAAVAHGFTFDGGIAIARLFAAILAVCLLSAVMRKALRSSPEKAPAAR